MNSIKTIYIHENSIIQYIVLPYIYIYIYIMYTCNMSLLHEIKLYVLDLIYYIMIFYSVLYIYISYHVYVYVSMFRFWSV